MSGLAHAATRERSDAELAAAGDELAFGRLVAEHQVAMLRLAYVILGERAMAQDAAQAAWVAAWRRLPSLRDPSRVRPWLMAIAANEARQIARRRRRIAIVDISGPMATGRGISSEGDPATSIARLDLVQALSRLSHEDRALLALRYVAGIDAGELGAAAGRSASGTRARLSRLTARLREELSE